jgi:hypothetical protein
VAKLDASTSSSNGLSGLGCVKIGVEVRMLITVSNAVVQVVVHMKGVFFLQ